MVLGMKVFKIINGKLERREGRKLLRAKEGTEWVSWNEAYKRISDLEAKKSNSGDLLKDMFGGVFK